MIDRYLVRYFLAVVDQGNFSRAAVHCNVTQPTLSVGIAKLEREIGGALFLRSNQRVQLTPAGSRFLVHARRIEIEFNLAVSTIDAKVSARALRLGILHSIPSPVIADAIRAVRHELAEQPVELLFGTERDLLGKLASGRVDVALTLCERGGEHFMEQPLLREGYAVMLPAEHPLSHLAEVSGEELSNETMIVRRHCELLAQTSRFFTDRGVRPHFALRSHNDERVLEMIAAGLGLTIMPASFSHPEVAQLELRGFGFERSVGLVFGRKAEHLRDAAHPLLAALAGRLPGLLH
jgi:DNA-binding transcriptional LysR family regulator